LEDLQGKRTFPVIREPVEAPYLIKALRHKSPEIRFNAAQDLKALSKEAKIALVPLVERYTDPERRVAAMSFAAVRSIGAPTRLPKENSSWSIGSPDPDPLPVLLKHLKSKNSQVRVWSLATLVTMEEAGRPAVEDVLLLVRDPNGEVRAYAQEFLSKIKANITPELVAALSSDSPDVRASAAIALGSRKETTYIPEIEALLDDSQASVRFSAAEALAMLGGGTRKAEVSSILSKSLGSLSPDKEKSISRLLSKIGYSSLVSSHKASVAKSKRANLRSQRERSESRARAAAERVRSKLLRDREKAQMKRLRTKENLRSAELELPRLLAVVDTGNTKQKLTAIKSMKRLGKYYDPAVRSLMDALNHEQSIVRAAAAGALGELRVSSAISALSLTLDDENLDVQDNAIAALTQIGTPNALQAISHYPEEVRTRAVQRVLRGGGQVTPLVRCSEARSLCRMVLQEDGTSGRALRDQSKICAYQVQPGC
jgi:HEAT repeat protein